jgi:hypothetical protein
LRSGRDAHGRTQAAGRLSARFPARIQCLLSAPVGPAHRAYAVLTLERPILVDSMSLSSIES